MISLLVAYSSLCMICSPCIVKSICTMTGSTVIAHYSDGLPFGLKSLFVDASVEVKSCHSNYGIKLQVSVMEAKFFKVRTCTWQNEAAFSKSAISFPGFVHAEYYLTVIFKQSCLKETAQQKKKRFGILAGKYSSESHFSRYSAWILNETEFHYANLLNKTTTHHTA